MNVLKIPKIITNLEWTLIISVIISQLIMIRQISENIWLILCGLAIFSMLGMWRSSNRILNYTNSFIQCFIIATLSIWGKLYGYQLLFLVTVIRSCLLLKAIDQYIVSGFIFSCILSIQTYRQLNQQLPLQLAHNQPEFVMLTLNLLSGMLVISLQLLIDKILVEEQNKQELAIANQKLRDYALKVEELATVKERNRIAREIHDGLGHSLTVFNLYLETALRLMQTDREEAKTFVKEAKQVSSKVLADVRQSVSSLRNDPLEGLSLVEAIYSLTNEFKRSTGILPETELVLDINLSQSTANTIYRIIQESLTNISKHASANLVSINIHQSANMIDLTITDNGIGFDLSKNTTGFGLQGMKERAIALDGKLEIITAPHQGCKLQAKIPVQVS